MAAFVGFAVTSPDSGSPVPEAAPGSAAAPGRDDIAAVVIETPDLLTSAGLAHFLAEYREKFGDMAADSVYLYPEFATIDRAVPGATNREVGYDYRGGFTQSDDITTRRTDTQAMDLGLLDPAAIGTAAANAVEATRVPGGAVSMMIVAIESSGDLAGRPVVRIYVQNEFDESGTVYVDPVGAILDISIFEG